jgi:hypothetical protein
LARCGGAPSPFLRFHVPCYGGGPGARVVELRSWPRAVPMLGLCPYPAQVSPAAESRSLPQRDAGVPRRHCGPDGNTSLPLVAYARLPVWFSAPIGHVPDAQAANGVPRHLPPLGMTLPDRGGVTGP